MARDPIELYLDEHVPGAVAAGLRRRGIDVLTPKEAGTVGATDEEHLARALRERRVVFTQDIDFLRLHAAGHMHTGIAYMPKHTEIGAIVRSLVLLAEVIPPREMVRHVEFP